MTQKSFPKIDIYRVNDILFVCKCALYTYECMYKTFYNVHEQIYNSHDDHTISQNDIFKMHKFKFMSFANRQYSKANRK